MSSIGADNVHSTNSESKGINDLNNTVLLRKKCLQLKGAKNLIDKTKLSKEKLLEAKHSISRARQEFHSKYEMFLVSKTRFNLPVFKYYDRTSHKGAFKYLSSNNKELEFNCFLDNSCSFLSEQFLYFETESPQYDETKHPNIDASRVRYRYAAYPGLRLIDNVVMELCDDPLFDEYNVDQAKFFNAQCVSERARAKWNECLGHDGEVEALVEFRDFQVDQVQKFRIGNQTFKASQPGLKLMIPLLFQHSMTLENALQIDSLQSKALGFRFRFANLCKIVKAILAEVNPGDGDESLELKDLPIKDIKLYSRFYNFDDDVYNSLIEPSIVKMYKTSRIEESARLSTNKDILKLKFTRYACEYINFTIVQKCANECFDQWYKFGYRSDPILLATPAVRVVAGNPILYTAAVNLFPRRNIIDKFTIANATTKLNTNTTHREEHYEIISTYDQFRYCQEQGTRYYAQNKYDQEYGTYAFAAKPGLTNKLTGLFSFTVNREFKIEYKLIDEFDECKLQNEHLRFIFYYKCVNFISQNKGHAAKVFKL